MASTARRDADGSVYYFFADRLGSAGVVTDAQGFYKDIRLFYPYGGIQRWLNWGVAGWRRPFVSGLRSRDAASSR